MKLLHVLIAHHHCLLNNDSIFLNSTFLCAIADYTGTFQAASLQVDTLNTQKHCIARVSIFPHFINAGVSVHSGSVGHHVFPFDLVYWAIIEQMHGKDLAHYRLQRALCDTRRAFCAVDRSPIDPKAESWDASADFIWCCQQSSNARCNSSGIHLVPIDVNYALLRAALWITLQARTCEYDSTRWPLSMRSCALWKKLCYVANGFQDWTVANT